MFALNSADSGYQNGSGSGVGVSGVVSDSDDVSESAVVTVEQLLSELQSVAVEWRSLRQATSCSCAMPFEHHSKKVTVDSLALSRLRGCKNTPALIPAGSGVVTIDPL